MSTLAEAVGSALLHFLWQGSLIGAFAFVALWLLRGASAHTRYLVASALFFAAPMMFVITVSLLLRPAPAPILSVPGEAARSLMPGVAWVWIGGALLMSARMLFQMRCVRRLRLDARSDVESRWQQEVADLCHQLGIRRSVRLLQSTIAEAPMVVGWVSPIILMPVTAMTSLSTEQLRAVLAHELAHIRRYDHLVNAIQSVVEVILFYHPAIWWLSSRIRLERENCCDDIAIRAAGPVALARALSELEMQRDAHPQAALAANGGTLMQRIARILGIRHDARPHFEWRSLVGATAAVTFGIVGLSHAASTLDQPAHQIDNLRAAVEFGAISDEKAREIYRLHLHPGSQADQKLEAHIALMEAEIAAAVEAGLLTRQEATVKRRAIDERRDLARSVAYAMQVKGLSHDDAYASEMTARINKQRLTGRLTEEDAAKKLRELEAKRTHTHRLHAHLARLHADIEAEVHSGALTEEQGKQKLHAMLRSIEAKVAAETKARTETQLADDLKAERIEALRRVNGHTRIRLEALTRAKADAEAAKREAGSAHTAEELKRRLIELHKVHEATTFELHQLKRNAAAGNHGEHAEKAEAKLRALVRQYEYQRLAVEKAAKEAALLKERRENKD